MNNILIGIVPTTDMHRGNNVFNLNNFNVEINPWKKLDDTKDFIVHTIDLFDFKEVKPDVIVFLGLDWLVSAKAIYHKIPTIYIAAESPIIELNHQHEKLISLNELFSEIYTWNSLLYKNVGKYRPFYYWLRKEELFKFPTDFEISQKKLLSSVQSYIVVTKNNKKKYSNELYAFRAKLNANFSSILGEQFGIYGSGWGNDNPSYRGYTDDKFSSISGYKFNLAIENCTTNSGYISEKILDAFVSRVVPIYIGAENISELIPKDCYIDLRDFSDEHEVANFLNEMSLSTYKTFLYAAEKFLNSNDGQKFTMDYFLISLSKTMIDLSDDDWNYYLTYLEVIELSYRALVMFVKRFIKCLLSRLGYRRFGCYKH